MYAGLYKSKTNLMNVITNGTGMWGSDDIDSLAPKSVMKVKTVLFNFLVISIFYIEIDKECSKLLLEAIERLEPAVGGLNLEGFKAPNVLFWKKILKKRLSISVFYDDQHYTVIVVASAVMSATTVVGKDIKQIIWLPRAPVLRTGTGDVVVNAYDCESLTF